MARPLVIGLYSPLPQSGKTSVAIELAKRGFVIVPFAATLKAMCRLLLYDLGLDDSAVAKAMNSAKEEPLKELGGKTPRQAMQLLGTEWGRRRIDQDIWVRAWLAQVERQRQEVGVVAGIVADDMRFPNEMAAVRGIGGHAVRVVRPDGASEAFAVHASEGALDGMAFDHTLVNDGDLDQLARRTDQLLETLRQPKVHF